MREKKKEEERTFMILQDRFKSKLSRFVYETRRIIKKKKKSDRILIIKEI
jgi:hypothetical protein